MKNNYKKVLKDGLAWGIPMFLTIEILLPYSRQEPITPRNIITGIFIWIIFGGVLFGYLINIYVNKK